MDHFKGWNFDGSESGFRRHHSIAFCNAFVELIGMSFHYSSRFHFFEFYSVYLARPASMQEFIKEWTQKELDVLVSRKLALIKSSCQFGMVLQEKMYNISHPYFHID